MSTTVDRARRIVRTYWRHPVGAARRAQTKLATARKGSAHVTRPASPGTAVPDGFAAVVTAERLGRPERTVVVLADRVDDATVQGWLRLFDQATIHVVSRDPLADDVRSAGEPISHVAEAHTIDAVTTQLKAIGPLDVIVNLMGRTVAEHRTMWERLFLHLKPKGWYVVDARFSKIKPFTGEGAKWMAALIGSDDGKQTSSPSLASELTRSVAQVDVSRDVIRVKKRQRHLAKVRDAEANRILRTREPHLGLTELAHVPGGQFTCSGKVVSHRSTEPVAGLDTTITYPELHLRHYRGRIAMVSNGLVHTDDTILPDSFRHHLETNPRNPRIINISPNFARISPNYTPEDTLRGSYYHLDSENSGHFGHLMTEVMSRMWGWHEAKQAIPDLKAIFRIRRPNERDPALERQLFGAYGIAADDIVYIDRPRYVESLVAATPMWHNKSPFYVHPRIRETWNRIADNLIDPEAPEYPKIFVSRTDRWNSRQCRNQRAVEELFAAHGFEIVYPELFDLGTQAGIFSKARVIAGFGGSAMFNMLYARRLSTVVILNHEAYWPRNEHLYTSVLGPDVHYFWSPSDPPDPAVRLSGTVYSNWEFDFARNGDELRELLRSL